MTDIDWGKLQLEFDILAEPIRHITLLDDKDFELLQLRKLTYGLFKGSAWDRIDLGLAYYVNLNKGREARDLWTAMALELRWQISAGLMPPDHAFASMEHHEDHFQIVADAISARRASHAFLRSWGRLHALNTQFKVLSIADEASGVLMQLALKGAENTVRVQKHWYAQWLLANARSLRPDDRVPAAQALGVLCADIRDGKVQPWTPYPRDWFVKLLTSEGKKDDVNDNFAKLGRPAIEELTRDPYITPEILPPLTIENFEQGWRSPGGGEP